MDPTDHLKRPTLPPDRRLRALCTLRPSYGNLGHFGRSVSLLSF